MSLPAIKYRTAGAWGGGEGANLPAADIDGNFYNLAARATALETSPPTPVQITSVTVSGSQMTIHMSNSTTFGPFTLPSANLAYRGAWAAATGYIVNDIFQNGQSLYIVTTAHTSPGTFNPASSSISLLFTVPTPALNPRGAWAISTVYAVNDIVTINALGVTTLYLVIYPHTSSGSSFSATANDGAGHNYYKAMLAVPTIPTLNPRGAWVASTVYSVGDTVYVIGTTSTITYLVIFAHTSGTTFSPTANDGAGHSYYAKILEVDKGAAGANGTNGTDSINRGSQALTSDFTLFDVDDGGRMFRNATAGNVNVTVPTTASVAYPVGTEFHFMQAHTAGTLQVLAASGVTFNKRSGTTPITNGFMSVFSIKRAPGSNTWDVFGDYI